MTAAREGGEVVLTVRDSGVGIAPSMLARVFEPFAQESQTLERSRGGLGLGLAIVRSLVVLHGGSVHAHSDGIGHGSTFVVRLPAPAAEGATTSTVSPSAAPAAAPVREGYRVLVVDDNADAARLLTEWLRAMGHTVRVVHDGLDALRLAPTFAPQVALLDIGLPGMDGYELGARLRDEVPGVALIAVTGYGQKADRERSRKAGFDIHLVKPIDVEALEDTIRALVAV